MVMRVIRLFYASAALTLLPTVAMVGLFTVVSIASPAQAASQQDQKARIKDKAERAKAGLERSKNDGVDVQPMVEKMQQVRPRLQDGDLDGAEALLDEVLVMQGETVETEASPSKASGSNKYGNSKKGKRFAEDRTVVAVGPYSRIKVKNEEAPLGYADPSVEYGDDSVGWMSYSAVTKGFGVQTHLARSDDNGATWQYVQTINKGYDDRITDLNGKKKKGQWRDEVSTLVYDPDDQGREWKLFSHHYFTGKKNKRMPKFGWVAYSYASRPDGQWSEPVPLFGAGKFPPEPYDRDILINLNSLHRDLRKVVAYTEMGVARYEGELFMSLTAHQPGGRDIVLIRSRDHGESWEYVGKILTESDAKDFGYKYFNGTAIAIEDGRVFLFASPGPKPVEHDGTFIIEFEDIYNGQLKRDQDGKIVVQKYLEPDYSFVEKQGAGQSDYHEMNTAGGIVMPQFNWGAKPVMFQIYSTGQGILD